MVLKNLSYLASLKLWNMAIPLISYPYLIRTLGSSSYGVIILAQAVTFYFSVFVNLGYEISGTRKVAILYDNKVELSKYYINVICTKLTLWLLGLPVLYMLFLFFDSIDKYKLIYFLCYASLFFDIFLTHWFFKGLEKMKVIALLSFFSKIIGLVFIFIFINNESDYIYLAYINLTTSIVTSMLSIVVVIKFDLVMWANPSVSLMRKTIVDSLPFFYSSVFGVLTSKLNGIIIGFSLGTSDLALYSLAERVSNLVSSLLSSIGQVVLPNLAKSKSVIQSKKIFKYTFFVSTIISLSIYSLAHIPIYVLGGDAMMDTVPIMKIFCIYIFCSGVGPLLSNVIILNKYDSFLWKNMLFSTFSYLSLVSVILYIEDFSLIYFAYSFNVSVLFMIIHRLYYVRVKGLWNWVY